MTSRFAAPGHAASKRYRHRLANYQSLGDQRRAELQQVVGMESAAARSRRTSGCIRTMRIGERQSIVLSYQATLSWLAPSRACLSRAPIRYPGELFWRGLASRQIYQL